MSQFEFVSHLICADTNNPFVGNENNIMVWSKGENSIPQTIDAGGLLTDLAQRPANCASSIIAPLREAGNEILPPNMLENASYGKVIKREGREIEVAINERGEGTSKINPMARFIVLSSMSAAPVCLNGAQEPVGVASGK